MAILMGRRHEITDFETTGHANVCKIFLELIKPDDKTFVWYQPRILDERDQGHQPDFLIYAPWLGFLVIEVRDWAVLAFKSYTSQEIRLERNGITGVAANPMQVAKHVSMAVQSRIARWPGLRAYPCLILSEISRDDFIFHGLPAAFCGVRRILFADDFRPEGRLIKDRSGNKMKRLFSRMFQPMPVPLPLTPEALIEALKMEL